MKVKKIISAFLALCLMASMLNVLVLADSDDVILHIDFEDYNKSGSVPNGFTEEPGLLWTTTGGCSDPYVDENGNTMLKVTPRVLDPVWRYELPQTLNEGKYLMTFRFKSTKLEGIRSYLYFSDMSQNARHAIDLKYFDKTSPSALEKIENGEMLTYSVLFDFSNAQMQTWLEDDYESKTVTSISNLKTAGLSQFWFVYWDKINPDEYVLMDDIKIVRQPISMGIDNERQHIGNIFYDNEEIYIPVILSNDSSKEQTVTLTYSAKSRSGKAAGEGEKQITIPANESVAEDIRPEMSFYDTAVVTVTVTDERGEKTVENYDFSRVLSSPKTNDRFGICTHDLRGPAADVEYKAQMISKAGFGSVRGDMEWFRTETTQGNVKELSGWKEYLDDLVKYDMDFLSIAGLGNSLYDSGGLPYTEQSVKAFANYAGYLAGFLKQSGHNDIEVWNEADLMGNAAFNPASRPASDYRKLMIETAKEVRKANPDANIIGGVQANVSAESWMREVLDEGGADCIDTYSIHPYNHTTAPETGGLLDKVARIREILDEYNPEIDLWLTEMGYFTALQPTFLARQHTIEEQAAWAVRMYMILENQDIASRIYWYDYINDGTGATNSEDNYGVVKAASGVSTPLAAKPIYLSVAAMNNMVSDATQVEIVNPDEKTYINRYKKADGRDMLVLWSLDMKDSIGIKSENSVSVYDLYGNFKCELSPVDGVLNLQIGYEPIYIIGNISTTEVTEPNITAKESYVTVCEGDVFKNTIFVNDGKRYALSVIGAEGVTVEDNDGSTSFTLKMNNKAGELTRIPAELKRDDGKTVFTCEYLIKKNEEPVTVTVLAQPYDFSNQNRWCAVVSVTNNTISSELSGNVKLTEPTDFAQYAKTVNFTNLGPKQTTTLKINLPEMVKKNARYIGVKATLDNGDEMDIRKYSSFAIADYADKEIVIDGKRSPGEWTGTALTMDKSTWVLGDQVLNGKMFSDENDLSANAWIMYDNEKFYLFVDVKDSVFSQDYKNDAIWNGDSIQIGIDDISGSAIYTTEYSEIGCALTPEGIQFYRWKSVDKRDSVVNNTEAVIKHEDGHTYYEMSIPWTELITKAENITDYYDFGFAMLVNDNDGYGRRGWCEYTSGIGRGKNTDLFGRLILSKPEDMDN